MVAVAAPGGRVDLTDSATRRLRIAHVTATFPPYWGGTGNVAFYNARELARRGHQVTVFTAAHGRGDHDDPTELTVERLPVGFRFGNAPFTPGLLKARGFDIVHLHYPFIFGAELTWLMSTARGIPLVITHHNDLIGDRLRRYAFAAYAAVSARLILRRARKYGVVSMDHAMACRLSPLFRKRAADIVEIPNGVNAEIFRPGLDGQTIRRRLGIPDRASVVLFVGAMDRAHHFKGVPRLLDAVSRLRRPDVVLVLVGDGDLRPRFVARAAALGLEDRTYFVGAVPHRELPPYFASADLLVAPSSPPESFGMVLIEAMACGVPVVAHAIPGMRAVVTNGADGLLANPTDIVDLASKIELLLADPALRARMGAAGRRKVEQRYDWPRIGALLERMYLGVLETAGSGAAPAGGPRC